LVSLYDNALTAIVFTHTGRVSQAREILSYFYSRVQSELLFGNGGYFQFRSTSGQPQGNRWLGDNAWLLIAVHNYESTTGDTQYAPMRDALSAWIRAQQDADGGLWGGTDSNGALIGKVTEGMIDAFNAVSGFDDFHTNLLGYLEAERWDTTEFLPVSWPGSEYYYALDNFSLGYCAFEGFPLRVLDAAERFKTTQWHALSGDSITGYCFDEDLDAVWMEGSAQMAVSLVKAGNIAAANNILAEISKTAARDAANSGLIGLPYASNVGTGYGNGQLWIGSDTNPCAAATTWFIMAAHGVDPMAVGYIKNIPANSKFW
jgi:hypothetical protein